MSVVERVVHSKIIMGKRQPASKRNTAKAVRDEVNDSDDEEIDEDDAFNSDDERKYGSFFDQKSKGKKYSSDDDDEDDEELDDSDDDDDDENDSDEDESDVEEDDGGQYMLDLLKNLEGDNNKSSNEKANMSLLAPRIPESQFASSVIPNAQLTLDSLMEGLKDTKGFGTIQKTMKHVAQGQATAAPLAKVVSDRVQRKVNYEIQSKEISLWSKAVQENRHAETLDFRPKQRLDVTRDMMMDQFVPTTDYEKEIHAALLAAGEQDESTLRQQENALDDDLGTNTITIEEYKKRHGQLAKMRALMFYHEQKRHHMNKIKSKKYRKIRKKQKERMNEAELEAQINDDPNIVRELQEKEEITRMKERATLAHKNTSKWAKRILKRGKNVDVDTRRALSAQLQRGDDLRQRMTGENSDSENSDGDDMDLVSQARKVLTDTEPNNDADGLGKGIFQLAFMKKGLEKQRDRAKEEARQLLMELEDDETNIDSDDDDRRDNSDSEAHPEEIQRKPKKPKVASAKEMEHILKQDALMVESLKHGASSAVATSGNIEIDTMGKTSTPRESTNLSTGEEHTTIASRGKKNRTGQEAVVPSIASEESNPWLASVETQSSATDTTTKIVGKSTKLNQSIQTAKQSKLNRLFVDVDRAVDLLEDKPNPKMVPDSSVMELPDETSKPVKKQNLMERNITTLTQEELVQRAFATQQEQSMRNDDVDDDDDDSFAKEKARIEEDEDPTRRIRKEKEMKVSKGWGEWAGEGVKAPGPLNTKKLSFLPKKLQPPLAQPTNKRQRADAKKPNVIISEKRISKLADKYMIKTVPYPYTTREEYERSMQGGIGREWNVTDSFKDLTRPEIYARAGKIIQPLSKKVKHVRGPAKF